MTAPDVAEVEATNAAFYEAFEAGDLDAMGALWVDDADTVCVHPGGTPIRGTAGIQRSWALIMANAPYLQFFLTDVDVVVQGDVATVTCTENVLTAEELTDDAESFESATAVATNVFVRTGGRWRLWVRHASPVLSEADHDDDD